MRERADVRSLQALHDARAALADFREVIRVALGEAVADAQRTQFWIASEGRLRWRAELKRRQAKLQQAKSELARAEMSTMASAISVREEKALVERWNRAVREAEEKQQALKRWNTILDREITLFKGQLQTLARTVEADLPKADGKLLRMIDSLEQYIRLPVGEQRPARPMSTEEPAKEEETDP